ncbi:uncharacterized protein V6R79_024565 [Siganus canaliculatus]
MDSIKIKDTLVGHSNKYLIRGFLGQGTFGKVARCRVLETKETVAVKIIKVNSQEAFLKELRMLERIREFDPDKNNLVRLIDHFNYLTFDCLVFEMLGQHLYELLSDREGEPLCLSEVRVIAHQLLVALCALKSLKIVHADIKPDNIVLINHKLKPFKVKLIDFGLSIDADDINTYYRAQAVAYRAPEVMLGIPYNEPIDMWSLGCVLVFLCSNRHLVPLKCPYEAIRAIVQMQDIPDHMLQAGRLAYRYFNKGRKTFGGTLKMNTRFEYQQITGKIPIQDNRPGITFRGLERCYATFKNINMIQDSKAFLSLLQQILHVDPEQRITPSAALRHPYITLNHLPSCNGNDPYLKKVQHIIKRCQLERPQLSAAANEESVDTSHLFDSQYSMYETEKKSPKKERHAKVQDRRTAKPVQDQRTAKPVQDQQTRKPVQDQQTRKPVQDQRTAKPVQDQRTAKPVQDQQDAKPVQDQQDAKPVQDQQDAKPVQDQQDAKPVQDQQDAKPVPAVQLNKSGNNAHSTFKSGNPLTALQQTTACPWMDSNSSGTVSAFVEVKTRNKWIERIRSFFSRLFSCLKPRTQQDPA